MLLGIHILSSYGGLTSANAYSFGLCIAFPCSRLLWCLLADDGFRSVWVIRLAAHVQHTAYFIMQLS